MSQSLTQTEARVALSLLALVEDTTLFVRGESRSDNSSAGSQEPSIFLWRCVPPSMGGTAKRLFSPHCLFSHFQLVNVANCAQDAGFFGVLIGRLTSNWRKSGHDTPARLPLKVDHICCLNPVVWSPELHSTTKVIEHTLFPSRCLASPSITISECAICHGCSLHESTTRGDWRLETGLETSLESDSTRLTFPRLVRIQTGFGSLSAECAVSPSPFPPASAPLPRRPPLPAQSLCSLFLLLNSI